MGLKVVVLAGGSSAEREVSLRSGAQVGQALTAKGHQVLQLDPRQADFVSGLSAYHPEVVFLALHGKGGEDGTIQGLLETLGYPYTGSGVLASAVAMNKELTKLVLSQAGLPVPAGLLLKREDCERADWSGHLSGLADLGWPLIVKPNSQGSTIGLMIAKEISQLEMAVNEALKYDDEVLIEELVKGVEITAGVLGNAEPFALPVVEVTSENELYDYEAKYTQGMSHHIIPARLSNEVLGLIQEYAVRAHQALGCRGISRTDMIITVDKIVILEVNTIPGMTAVSLMPDAAAAVGIAFPELCDKLLNFALEPRS